MHRHRAGLPRIHRSSRRWCECRRSARPPCPGWSPSVDNAKHPPDGSCARLGAHCAQRRGCSCALQQQRIARHRRCPRQRGRDQRRLVEPARPQPPAVERHRHQQIGVVRHDPNQLPRDRLGKGDPPAIFEAQRHRPRDIAIGNRRTNPSVSRRTGETRVAARPRPLIDRERTMTRRAPGRRKEAQPAPACRAEAMIGAGDRTTARTPRRQRKIGDETQRGEPGGHVPPCRARPHTAQAAP